MHERKARMAELSDGVIVLPGGFGTLDESFELLTWNQLGLLAVPVVFLDVAGFFASVVRVRGRHAVEAGFVRSEHAALVQRAPTAVAAIDWPPPPRPLRPQVGRPLQLTRPIDVCAGK